MSINKVIIMGNLTRDPEQRQTQGGMVITSFGIAVNRRVKEKDDTSFFDVTTFGKTAEYVAQYLTKGNRVIIDGRLQQETWQAQDGQNRSKVVIIADNVQNLTPREQGAPQQQQPSAPPPSTPPPALPSAPPQQPSAPPQDDPIDDLPF